MFYRPRARLCDCSQDFSAAEGIRRFCRKFQVGLFGFSGFSGRSAGKRSSPFYRYISLLYHILRIFAPFPRRFFLEFAIFLPVFLHSSAKNARLAFYMFRPETKVVFTGSLLYPVCDKRDFSRRLFSRFSFSFLFRLSSRPYPRRLFPRRERTTLRPRRNNPLLSNSPSAENTAPPQHFVGKTEKENFACFFSVLTL